MYNFIPKNKPVQVIYKKKFDNYRIKHFYKNIDEFLEEIKGKEDIYSLTSYVVLDGMIKIKMSDWS